ncbi:MAG: hypothetical protein MZV64_11055 [Ignavibacteriales bacterium]|nr:hypothetical protein [Ignavibacteriales bacterium]
MALRRDVGFPHVHPALHGRRPDGDRPLQPGRCRRLGAGAQDRGVLFRGREIGRFFSRFREVPLSGFGSGYASCSPAPGEPVCTVPPAARVPSSSHGDLRGNIPRRLGREARKWEKNQ